MIEHLSRNEVQALCDLAAIAEAMGIRLMLVGANARRLVFDIPFGFPSPRTTQDWDFAAPMESWEDFTRFYAQAVHATNARFRPGESAHRIRHLATGILLDLIPFGALAESPGNIRWPQSQQVMSILGFEEAFACCIHEKLPNGIELGLVTPPLLAVLKIMAFSDRGDQISRDLLDFWFIMERYARPSTQESRVFEELADLFPDDSYYEHFNSLLLGWDMGRACQPATLAAVARILDELSSEGNLRIEPLLPGGGDFEAREARRREITTEFGWLGKGLALAAKVRAAS